MPCLPLSALHVLVVNDDCIRWWLTASVKPVPPVVFFDLISFGNSGTELELHQCQNAFWDLNQELDVVAPFSLSLLSLSLLIAWSPPDLSEADWLLRVSITSGTGLYSLNWSSPRCILASRTSKILRLSFPDHSFKPPMSLTNVSFGLVAAKQKDMQALQSKIQELDSSSEGKVDKQIMKSLVLGYFSSPNDKKHEVQRLLARILDFNQEDMNRVKMDFGNKGRNQKSQSDSLSTLFVQFLENESRRTDDPGSALDPSSKTPSNSSTPSTEQQPRRTSQADPFRELAKNLYQSSNSYFEQAPRLNPFVPTHVPLPAPSASPYLPSPSLSQSHTRSSSTSSTSSSVTGASCPITPVLPNFSAVNPSTISSPQNTLQFLRPHHSPQEQ